MFLHEFQGLAGTGPAHKQHGWARSRALLGSIGNIPRARVMELNNPDQDRPLAPHFRAAQLQ